MRTLFGLGLVLVLAGAVWAHDHVGPHKGPVVEWGDEEYHPELVFDAKAGTVTVYVYGDHDDLHAKKLKAIDSKSLTLVLKTSPATTIKLEPTPEKDDPAGKSTKFVGKHDALKAEKKWEGTLGGKVGTKPYSGEFKQK